MRPVEYDPAYRAGYLQEAIRLVLTGEADATLLRTAYERVLAWRKAEYISRTGAAGRSGREEDRMIRDLGRALLALAGFAAWALVAWLLSGCRGLDLAQP